MRTNPVLRAVLLLVVLAFVAFTAWDLAGRWQQAPVVAPHPGWVLASVLPLVVMSLAQAQGFIAQVHRMVSQRMPWIDAMELFLAAMLGRYSPAKVGLPAILLSRAQRVSITPTIAGSAMVLVLLVYTLLGVGLGVGTLAAARFAAVPQLEALGRGLGPLVLGGMALGLLLLVLVDRRYWPARLLQRVGVEGRGPLVGAAMPLWYALAFAAYWVHGLFLVRAVGGQWPAAMEAAGLFVLAPVLGFLALIAPGGLGVREAVVAGGLAGVVGSGPAVVAALLSRVAAVAVDVGAWAWFRWAVRRRAAAAGSAPDEGAPERPT